VRELFAQYLRHSETLGSLAKHLLATGLPSPRGNPRWSAASLRDRLRTHWGSPLADRMPHRRTSGSSLEQCRP
jgi:hypothetical protein